MKSLKYTLNNSFLFDLSPYELNYQIPRALIALAQLMNLTFTQEAYLFGATGPATGLFSLPFAQITATLVLLWVISGYLPQLSAPLHAYLSFSFFSSSIILEGSDQVAQIITLLLIPICLFDRRMNLWGLKKYFRYKIPEMANLFARSCLRVIQLQMAFIYLFAGAVKIGVPQWKDGSALYYWFNHTMGAAPFVKDALGWALNSHFLSPVLNWGVLLLEFLLFGALFMVQSQKEKLLVPALLFHFLIGIVFGLWAFGLIMSAGLLLYLTPAFLYQKKKSAV